MNANPVHASLFVKVVVMFGGLGWDLWATLARKNVMEFGRSARVVTLNIIPKNFMVVSVASRGLPVSEV